MKLDWSIEHEDYDKNNREVTLNGVVYKVDDKTALISQSIAMIVEILLEINDNLEEISANLYDNRSTY